MSSIRGKNTKPEILVRKQPVKIENPVLIENGPATRYHCIQFAYIHARNSYKILKRLQGDISGIKSDIKDIKTQLDEMRKPWWRRVQKQGPSSDE